MLYRLARLQEDVDVHAIALSPYDLPPEIRKMLPDRRILVFPYGDGGLILAP
jgi:hypothetical protein